MLGAGFVTRPTLDILSEAGIPVTVGMCIDGRKQLQWMDTDVSGSLQNPRVG